eukprot:3528869-Alexandrium_andersonii.AAC.1
MVDPVDMGEGRDFSGIDPRSLILFSPAPSPAADAVPATEPDSSGADAGWGAIPSPGGPASLELVR